MRHFISHSHIGRQISFLVQTNCADGKSFKCSYITCIPLVYKCDGIADCVDRSDETSCQFPRTCQ